MSGPLLLGIAAVGIGWAYIHRDGPTPPGPIGHAAGDVAETVGDEVGQAADGVAAVLGSLNGGCATNTTGSTLGAIPVEGSDGGQVVQIKSADTPAIVKPDPNASLGGADPSTLDNSLHTGVMVDHSPPFWKGDSMDVIMASRYGVDGAAGMTQQQAGNAYREAAVWSNEVF